jgi:hypothetical protein
MERLAKCCSSVKARHRQRPVHSSIGRDIDIPVSLCCSSKHHQARRISSHKTPTSFRSAKHSASTSIQGGRSLRRHCNGFCMYFRKRIGLFKLLHKERYTLCNPNGIKDILGKNSLVPVFPNQPKETLNNC